MHYSFQAMGKGSVGQEIWNLAKELWPLCRSLSGQANRESFKILKNYIPLEVHEIASGSVCFDWTVPLEWNPREAWIKDPHGNIVVDFSKNNLHLLNYSTSVHEKLSLQKLQSHLHSLPAQPHAIPYITSYYRENWGFCLSHEQREKLVDGTYEVKIDADIKPGSLTFADLLIPGESKEEIFFSTYICHPSLANDNLSGPCVATFLARYLIAQKKRRYSYRFAFVPETIGAICYLHKNLKPLQQHVAAGFILTCLGDDRGFSFLSSRQENTLADRVAQHVLKHLAPNYKSYSFLQRGSDERQYCAPGVNLPVASIMRSKYGEFPEYHTSLDDLNFVSPKGLDGGFEAMRLCVECLEANEVYQCLTLGEAMLGKRGLYPSLGTKENARITADITNVMAYSDGKNDLIAIAEKMNRPLWELQGVVKQLCDTQVIAPLRKSSS